MLHVYTFGKGSIQFLILSPKSADLMNRFTDAFFEAQAHFLEEHGRRWQPNEYLAFNANSMSRDEFDAYNKLAKACNRQHKIRNKIFRLFRIDVSQEEFDDYLVKRF